MYTVATTDNTRNIATTTGSARNIIAYTDGSYKNVDNFGPVYAGAAIICCDSNDPVVLTTAGADPKYLKYRNVSGEILAVIMACEYCMNQLKVTQEDKLLIVHDYNGLHNWVKKPGEADFWRAKNPISMAYRDFINTKVKTRCKLMFKCVKGHGDTRGNILADQQVNLAIENYVRKFVEEK